MNNEIKIYVFDNVKFPTKWKEAYKCVSVKADTILEAKKKVKELGHRGMIFRKIRLAYE